MNKIEFGQFFTKGSVWLTEPVISFIKENLISSKIILDPFAGAGDLFLSIKDNLNYKNKFKYIGYDIDRKLGWKINDSLKYIPKLESGFILTNPPYLSKNSCSRNKFVDTYNKYFKFSNWSDLYLIALEKMINTNMPGIAIVPETIINSGFPMNKINKIIIIEPNPFKDTEVPICVVCFNGKSSNKTKIYKNNEYINFLDNLKKMKPKPDKINLIDLKFNDIEGSIALKGVDSTNPNLKIQFLNPEDLDYDFSAIKQSSRAITIIKSDYIDKCSISQKNSIINEANIIFNNFREKTSDVLLSPFKGNNKNLTRRRRIDFKLARNIIEIAYNNIVVRKGVTN